MDFWSIKFSQVSNHFHSCADIRYQSPFTKSLDLPVRVRLVRRCRLLTDCSVCLAIFRHRRGLREPQKVSLNLSLKLCHPFFPLFPTELIRSQLFSCIGVKFLSLHPSLLPRAPSKITNTALCSADYCDILIKRDLKGRRHCNSVNPHRSFTLFKQIRQGLYPFGPTNSFSTKGGL